VQFAQAQPTTCTFSCPDTNVAGQALLSRILAAPNESNYSIFECVYAILLDSSIFTSANIQSLVDRYGEVNENPRTQSCFYYKVRLCTTWPYISLMRCCPSCKGGRKARSRQSERQMSRECDTLFR
jgi:hypothetical protein